MIIKLNLDFHLCGGLSFADIIGNPWCFVAWFSSSYDLHLLLDFVLVEFNERFRDCGRFELNFCFILVHKPFMIEMPFT